MGLLTLTSHGIQQAQTTVAVCLEGAHAERLGQGKSLGIRGLGLLDLRLLVVHGDLTEQVQGMSLVATLLILLGEVEGRLRTFECVLQTVSEQIAFAERSEP